MFGWQVGLLIIPLISIGHPWFGGLCFLGSLPTANWWALYHAHTLCKTTSLLPCRLCKGRRDPSQAGSVCNMAPSNFGGNAIWPSAFQECTPPPTHNSWHSMERLLHQTCKSFTPLQKRRNRCCLGWHKPCNQGKVGGERKKWNKTLWSGNKSKRVSEKGDRFPYCYITVSQGTSPVSVFPFGNGW